MHTEEIFIDTANGEKLAATVFYPQTVRAAVMMAPATGMLRRFYRPFAEYLAAAGFAVITYDNQSIGGSMHGRVSASAASLVSWGATICPRCSRICKRCFPIPAAI